MLNMSSGISGFKGGINAQLVSDGTWLYGMTSGGGKYSDGIIYKIKPDGSLYTKLMDFDGTQLWLKPTGIAYFVRFNPVWNELKRRFK